MHKADTALFFYLTEGSNSRWHERVTSMTMKGCWEIDDL